MEIYKFIDLDNNDILLSKIIIDKTNYTIINKDNGDILLKKITSINISEIKDINNYNYKKSNIIKCLINEKEFNKLKYKSILEHIYNSSKIIKNSKLNKKMMREFRNKYSRR